MNAAISRLTLATQNTHKIKELQSLLANEIIVNSCRPHISWHEDGDSFAANAKIKCFAIRQEQPGAILGDDSGLVVDALNGAPGIHSSRYSGPGATDRANYQKLLEDLKDFDGRDSRKAHFICCLALLDEKDQLHLFEGRLEGYIAAKPEGSEGFGYDPIFIPAGYQQTLASLTAAEKNRISHRFLAMQQLKAFLQG